MIHRIDPINGRISPAEGHMNRAVDRIHPMNERINPIGGYLSVSNRSVQL